MCVCVSVCECARGLRRLCVRACRARVIQLKKQTNKKTEKLDGGVGDDRGPTLLFVNWNYVQLLTADQTFHYLPACSISAGTDTFC